MWWLVLSGFRESPNRLLNDQHRKGRRRIRTATSLPSPSFQCELRPRQPRAFQVRTVRLGLRRSASHRFKHRGNRHSLSSRLKTLTADRRPRAPVSRDSARSVTLWQPPLVSPRSVKAGSKAVIRNPKRGRFTESRRTVQDTPRRHGPRKTLPHKPRATLKVGPWSTTGLTSPQLAKLPTPEHLKLQILMCPATGQLRRRLRRQRNQSFHLWSSFHQMLQLFSPISDKPSQPPSNKCRSDASRRQAIC